MNEQLDIIVEISERHIRYFGGPGQMVLPSPASVQLLVAAIPRGQLLTTDLLRQALADRFGVRGACPVTTRKALALIASEPECDVPYWRVVNQNGELVTYFPGGVDAQAARLRAEGFTIDTSRWKPRVADHRARLFRVEPPV